MIEQRDHFDLYKGKAFNLSENKVYERDEKRASFRKLRSDETRNVEVLLAGMTFFESIHFY